MLISGTIIIIRPIIIIVIIMNEIHCDVLSMTSRLILCNKGNFILWKYTNHKKYVSRESLDLLRYATNRLSAGASPKTPLGKLKLLLDLSSSSSLLWTKFIASYCQWPLAWFCAKKEMSSYENTQKVSVTRVSPFTQICTKSFVGWGFAQDPTWEAYSAPPDPLAELRRPTSKGKRSGREGEGMVWKQLACLNMYS